MDLITLLQEHDKIETKNFDEFSLSTEIAAFIPSDPTAASFELKSELMAFDFTENYQHKDTSWGTYFGPKWVINNGDGTATENPSIRSVTEDTINYWNSRAEETSNPILRARYLALIFDFSEPILNKKPEFASVVKYIESLIEIAEGDYYSRPIYVFKKLERAMELAVRYNQQGLIERCKQAIINYEDKKAIDDKAGLWGYAFDLLNNKKVVFTDAEKSKIVIDLEARFERLINGQDGNKINPYVAQEAAFVLCDYYKSNAEIEKIREILAALTTAFETVEVSRAMQTSSWLERLYRIYRNYQLNNEADALLIRIREIGEQVVEEMNETSFSMPIDPNHVEGYLKYITDGSTEEILQRLAWDNITNIDRSKTHLEETAKNNPFVYLFGKGIIDAKGRAVASVGSIENEPSGNLMDFISQSMLMSPLFHIGMHKLRESGILNKAAILEMLNDSPIERANRFDLVELGLEAYFDSKFAVCAHILIPQIENAIRETLEISGGVVLKPAKKGNAFQLRTFDDLLRDQLLIDKVGVNFAYYFRVLFTDQLGWNLRNNVCHGLSEVNVFNQMTCDRIIHALLCIGLIKVTTNPAA